MKGNYLEIDNHSELLLSNKELIHNIQLVARTISNDYKDKNLLCLCVLNGGIVTLGQLLPLITCPSQVDSILATRYRGKTKGSVEVKWKVKPSLSLKNMDVLIIDDILDEGVTMMVELINYCKSQGAKSIKSMVLINKIHKKKGSVPKSVSVRVIILPLIII